MIGSNCTIVVLFIDISIWSAMQKDPLLMLHFCTHLRLGDFLMCSKLSVLHCQIFLQILSMYSPPFLSYSLPISSLTQHEDAELDDEILDHSDKLLMTRLLTIEDIDDGMLKTGSGDGYETMMAAQGRGSSGLRNEAVGGSAYPLVKSNSLAILPMVRSRSRDILKTTIFQAPTGQLSPIVSGALPPAVMMSSAGAAGTSTYRRNVERGAMTGSMLRPLSTGATTTLGIQGQALELQPHVTAPLASGRGPNVASDSRRAKSGGIRVRRVV